MTGRGRYRAWLASTLVGCSATVTPTVEQPLPIAAPEPATAGVTAGADHTCSWDDTGRVRCWGRNDRGQVGDGSTTERARPVEVQGLDAIAQVAAGAEHTCALDESGGVWCWGSSAHGQSGPPGDAPNASPVRIPGLSAVAELAAGARHTCARLEAGQVLCWGRWSTDPPVFPPQPVPSLAGSVRLVAGSDAICGLSPAGATTCWPPAASATPRELIEERVVDLALAPVPNQYETGGCGDGGCYSASVRGLHACAVRADGTVVCEGDEGFGQTRTDGVPVARAVAVTSSSSCALTSTGEVWCWGDAAWGTLGDGSREHRPGPVRALVPKSRGLAAGRAHVCAAADDGVWCWGDNRFGQLGNGSSPSLARRSAVRVGATDEVLQLSSVAGHACALTTDGRLGCWGSNQHFQSGRANASDAATDVGYAEVMQDVAQFALGTNHTCALERDGSVACFGFNRYGQLGDGTTKDSPKPVRVSGLSDAVALSAAGSGNCALRKNGEVVCWGENSDGALGPPKQTALMRPRAVAGIRGASVVAMGEDHGCAIVDGEVQCWGSTWPAGLLGCGTNDCGDGPVRVEGIRGATRLSIADRTTCAGLADGTVSCWGKARWGWSSDTDKWFSPQPAPDLSNVAMLSIPCAVDAEGRVHCWSDFAMPGPDPSSERAPRDTPPQPIPGLSGVTALASGDELPCALRSGEVWCWGGRDVDIGGEGIGHSAIPRPVLVSAP